MRTRFTIDVHGTPRTVFSISEQKKGDLNIHVTSGGRSYQGETFNDLVAIDDEVYFEDCAKHISVHTSPNSADVNVIKRTLKFSDRVEDHCQVTTGIKRDNLFIPILFRICGDLSRARYELPNPCSDSLISLGQMDPSKDQLRFMIVCSHSETLFPQDEEHPSNLLKIKFSNFTLTVIWSYLNKRSHPHAIDFFLKTKAESGPIRGLDWYEIYNLYTGLNMTHAEEYFRVYGGT